MPAQVAAAAAMLCARLLLFHVLISCIVSQVHSYDWKKAVSRSITGGKTDVDALRSALDAEADSLKPSYSSLGYLRCRSLGALWIDVARFSASKRHTELPVLVRGTPFQWRHSDRFHSRGRARAVQSPQSPPPPPPTPNPTCKILRHHTQSRGTFSQNTEHSQKCQIGNGCFRHVPTREYHSVSMVQYNWNVKDAIA